jgi:hypothetical protein
MPRLAINTLDRPQQYQEASADAKPDTHARYALVIVRGAYLAGSRSRRLTRRRMRRPAGMSGSKRTARAAPISGSS